MFSNLYKVSNRGDPLPLTGCRKGWIKTLEGKAEEMKDSTFLACIINESLHLHCKIWKQICLTVFVSIVILVFKISSAWEIILNGNHLTHKPPYSTWKRWASKSESYELLVLNWNQGVLQSGSSKWQRDETNIDQLKESGKKHWKNYAYVSTHDHR